MQALGVAAEAVHVQLTAVSLVRDLAKAAVLQALGIHNGAGESLADCVAGSHDGPAATAAAARNAGSGLPQPALLLVRGGVAS